MLTFPGHAIAAAMLGTLACASTFATPALTLASLQSPGATTKPTAVAKAPVDLAREVVACQKLIVVDCPSASVFDFDPNYPPFDAKWRELAKDAWTKNADARKRWREVRLAHQDIAPNGFAQPDAETVAELINTSRALANELGDAALYAESTGQQQAAIELVEDVLFLARCVETVTHEKYGRLLPALVGAGIRSLGCARLSTIAPALQFDDNEDRAAAMLAALDRVGEQLANEVLWTATFEDELAKADPRDEGSRRLPLIYRRALSEVRVTQVGLAVQRYRLDKGGWPAKETDLVPAYLAEMPADPSGKAGDRVRYVLVRNAPPLGQDRPIAAYRNDEAKDGGAWSIRTDRPCYDYSIGDGSSRRLSAQQKLVQARDLSRWVPPNAHAPTEKPATTPIQAE